MLAHEPKPKPRLVNGLVPAVLLGLAVGATGAFFFHGPLIPWDAGAILFFALVAYRIHRKMTREWESGQIDRPPLVTDV